MNKAYKSMISGWSASLVEETYSKDSAHIMSCMQYIIINSYT